MLVLYGDHLPALGLEAENMESSSLYRTEYIIWDNFGLEQQDEPLAAYQLYAMPASTVLLANPEDPVSFIIDFSKQGQSIMPATT